MSDQVRVRVYLDEDVVSSVNSLCDQLGVSLSDCVNSLLIDRIRLLEANVCQKQKLLDQRSSTINSLKK